MREKQDFQEIALTILGITPASAGKTLRLFSAVLICLGSPPRVREKQVRKIGIDVHDRITPASAGKTTSLKYFSTLVRDHPRECGKNLILYHLMFLILGSPPRVREKLHLPYKKVYDQRITPASAGKTFLLGCHIALDRDHPRECGKNCLARSLPLPTLGSPPRVREKRTNFNAESGKYRITPASAGKTCCIE